MRAFKRFSRRGFTLVELMIVVAIIGVLAALAIYGVRRYLASAKTAEAKNSIGAITRGAVAAYERETTPAEVLDGTTSAAAVHAFCGDASKVPAAPPAAKKYVPNTLSTADFNTGDSYNGWKCIRFGVQEGIYYSYKYEKGAGTINAGTLATANGFAITAQGDLDGNGVFSTFGRGADLKNGIPSVSTQMFVENEFE